MIFVDSGLNVNKTHEQFAYVNKNGCMELVDADTDSYAIEILDMDDDRISSFYWEDIPKLILALQAAYNFKFKENT